MTAPKNSTQARDIASHLHPYTNLKKHLETGPMVITRGDGVRVFDEDGKGYIEGLAGLWCTALGWGEDRLKQAAKDAIDRLPFYHNFGGKVPDVTAELAEKLLSMAPVPMSKVFFANSGSEANDTAIKLIWYYFNAIGKPDKKKIIARTKGYHGVTVATASLTGLPANHAMFDMPIDRILHTTCPHHYRFARDGETEEEFSTRCAEDLENLILDEGPDTIAAFFAEPVMGAGGVLPPPAGYFEKIQKVLKKYDVLLLADEVICGFGRTGNLWGSQTYGIEPDMITCAKALSSAYLPISALMINEKVFGPVMEQSNDIGIFGHGYTYGGHPVPAAVALETLKIYEEMDIAARVRDVAPHFQSRLKALGDHPLVGEARGIGLIGALEIVKNKETKESFDPKAGVGPHVWGHFHDLGLINRVIVDTPVFAPPLIIIKEEIDEMFDIVERALDKGEEFVAKEGLRA